MYLLKFIDNDFQNKHWNKCILCPGRKHARRNALQYIAFHRSNFSLEFNYFHSSFRRCLNSIGFSIIFVWKKLLTKITNKTNSKQGCGRPNKRPQRRSEAVYLFTNCKPCFHSLDFAFPQLTRQGQKGPSESPWKSPSPVDIIGDIYVDVNIDINKDAYIDGIGDRDSNLNNLSLSITELIFW